MSHSFFPNFSIFSTLHCKNFFKFQVLWRDSTCPELKPGYSLSKLTFKWLNVTNTASFENSTDKCNWTAQSTAAAAAKLLQLCPTLWDPIDGSPPGSPIPGILQTRTLEWVAISFSNAWKWKVKVKSFSRVRLLVQPTRLLYPWDFLGKSTGVGCHCLLCLEA